MKWEVIKSEIVMENEFFKIHKDKCKKTDGSIVEDYYTIDRPKVAVIAAITDKNEYVLVKQYRHPVKSIDIELPAGYIEENENIEQAAHRELLEETGYEVETMEEIHEVYSSAGLMSNNIHFFVGKNAKKVAEPKLDENEEIEVLVTPKKDLINLLEQGKIKDMASVAGLLILQRYLQKQ